jgi:hypothetical protein
LVVAFILSFTVVTVVALGVIAAYGLVTGILYAFAYGSSQRSRVAPALVPGESHASGD